MDVRMPETVRVYELARQTGLLSRGDRRLARVGHRLEWLNALRRDLAARHGRVLVGQPYEAWDFQARIAPFWAYRMTAAVAWNWIPARRLSLKPRLTAPAALMASVGLAFARPGMGSVFLAATGLLILLERFLLRSKVMKSFESATRGAGEPELS